MEQPSVREASARIDALLDELEQGAPPAVMDRVQELLRCVLSLYDAGLDRVMATAGDDLRRTLADDELVGNLLVLGGLHPDDVDTRVRRALETVRPYLGSHAGDVELLGVDDDGVVRLRLQGSCDGCPSSSETVRSAIEDAVLVAAPDVTRVEAEGMVERAAPQQLLQIQPFSPHDADAVEPAGGWQHVDLDVPPRTLRAMTVDATSILVANLDGTLVAYLDRCACGAAPSSGQLDGSTLLCACGVGYDLAHAGRAETASLTPVPLLPEHGGWRVSVPTRAVA